jgi:SAM-dependent methyltransferase
LKKQQMGPMMDNATLDAYDQNAAAFAEDWETQKPPKDLYEIVRRYFKIGLTADVGCGSGRDTAWLNANGYPARGYDASEGLLNEARRRHSGIVFKRSSLPNLEGIVDSTFANVLCETVLMHLDISLIVAAVQRLLAILVSDGVLYLSWRVTEGVDKHDNHGRLYSAFEPALVVRALRSAKVLLNESRVSESSGKLIHRIVAQRHR